ncbi:hypothetical protein BV22DRAFT_1041046 [Leucogyrophana mollusca]|uniref:Uncharacterized protein n=1 Tax=Leucogyrophana mollusca TaxID=85980 RepID=A0ACB8B2H8_9AGAM|nr:hypothetical protein BV22DRAFT_1041046 [Leucogyrophana mollusca]
MRLATQVMDKTWLVLRDQGAIVEEATDDPDEDKDGNEKVAVVDEKAAPVLADRLAGKVGATPRVVDVEGGGGGEIVVGEVWCGVAWRGMDGMFGFGFDFSFDFDFKRVDVRLSWSVGSCYGLQRYFLCSGLFGSMCRGSLQAIVLTLVRRNMR